MVAPKGNRFWEARSTHGRAPIFKAPDDLWAACLEYFEWVEANPLYESKPFAYQGIVVQEPVAKMRAMSIMGLCNFLDIGVDTWALYRGRQNFIVVVARAEQFIRQQKFEGASADLLNPNIIARDLGMADRQEHTGKDGAPIQTEEVGVTSTELARRIAFVLAKGMEDSNG
jgi:hypothetical protein